MSQVETPVLPSPRGAEAAKNPKTRLTAGGREERGQAFRSLLQTLDKGAGKAVAEKPTEPGRAETGDKAEAFPAERLADLLAMPPAEPSAPADGAADAARLLLGAGQTPAPETRPEPRREAGPRRDGFAALNGVLARAATGAADALEPAPRPATAEAGVALPTEEVALPDLPDATGLLDPKPAAAEVTAKDAGPDKPFTIAVIRQETHLPPVMRLSPLQQVAEPIRQAASELSASRAAGGSRSRDGEARRHRRADEDPAHPAQPGRTRQHRRQAAHLAGRHGGPAGGQPRRDRAIARE